jgi:hypothetical protein
MVSRRTRSPYAIDATLRPFTQRADSSRGPNGLKFEKETTHGLVRWTRVTLKAPQHVKTRRSHSSRSSAFSSSLSTLLYRTMSRCKLRTMIMATMTVRNNTMSSEFTMLNQCTLSGTCVDINR